MFMQLVFYVTGPPPHAKYKKKEHLSLLCSYKSTRLHEKREDMMTYDMIYLYVCDESQEELRVSREARNVRALQ